MPMSIAPAAPRVLIVEDDKRTSDLLSLYLRDSGYDTFEAHDGRAGIDLARRERPDLVVLDLMLPEVDGWSVCRELRSDGDVPILILSARQEEEDRLLGLGLGADDYVVKPFSPREVVLRVHAILRRLKRASPKPATGPIEIDHERRAAMAYGRQVALTPSEFRLLEALAGSPGRTFERSELLEHLYPSGRCVVHKVVDVHIGKLRQKLEPDPRNPKHIVTVRGFGYRFDDGE